METSVTPNIPGSGNPAAKHLAAATSAVDISGSETRKVLTFLNAGSGSLGKPLTSGSENRSTNGFGKRRRLQRRLRERGRLNQALCQHRHQQTSVSHHRQQQHGIGPSATNQRASILLAAELKHRQQRLVHLAPITLASSMRHRKRRGIANSGTGSVSGTLVPGQYRYVLNAGSYVGIPTPANRGFLQHGQLQHRRASTSASIQHRQLQRHQYRQL